MIFNNVHLTSFGNCKVTNWKSSIYTDFDRTELTYRGRVLASVEVPTLRVIEAAILVKGISARDIDKKLDDIAKWLGRAGTSKLFAKRDTTHYYLARCTKISEPEYAGNSARITAIFTCSDNRLYGVWNDEPIESATSELNNFTFDGRHCLNDMGCVFVMDSLDIVPSVYANRYEISGQSGTLRYSNGHIRCGEKKMTGTLHFVKQSAVDGLMSESEITDKIHAISSWLGNAERADLVLDSDTSRKYQAEVIDEQSVTRKDWENGSIKLKMVLQPYSTEILGRGTSVTALVLAANTVNYVSLAPGACGYETPLVISITNRSVSAITDLYLMYYDENDAEKTMRINGQNFSLSNSQMIVVNSLSTSVTIGSQNGIKYVKTGDFPVLSVNGRKRIGIKSATAVTIDVDITYNARWL